MKFKRYHLLGLLAALLLALVAAGCGGGDEEGTDTGGGGQAENVSGSVTILADWSGPEGKSFQAVLDGFSDANPDVDVTYRPSTNLAQDLSTSLEGGNPPDLAAVPQPALAADYQKRGELKEIEFARSTIEDNYDEDWVETGTIDGKLYGVFFKGANKSTVWYNVHAFEDAGVEPPGTWDEATQVADTIKASGVPPWSFGASEGWTLTDFFENLYLQQAGPDMYKQLTDHEIKWTDPSVKEALQTMADVMTDDNVADGIDGALQTDFATSISNVFANPPKAAMIPEGDFVPGVVAGQTPAKPQTDYDFFDFPPAGDSGKLVVSGGNEVIMFTDTPASRALLEYLASPEAGEIWAKRGGFSSPNKNVGEDAYSDEITKRAATGLTDADTVVFDMSDSMPIEFGSSDEFSILQDFIKSGDVDGAAQELEQAAAKAYK